MKLICLVAVAMFIACAQANKDMLMKIMQECQTSVGASDGDVASFVVHAPPENEAQMCLISCIMDKINMIKGGKLQKDGLLATVSEMTNADPVKMKFAEELYDECNGMGGGSDCESASKIGECLKINGMKKQIKFGL